MSGASSEGLDTFTENTASGELKFMDASTNTMFSLVPQKTVGVGETVTLLFSAAYDNNVLNLPVGTSVRAEVIVSFGNATAHGASAPDVDINGNGSVDDDEAYVRSVPTRIGLKVPDEIPGNLQVTLSDTAADIATTGTVTVGAPTIDLDTTGGTVTIPYDAGAEGGSVTNCAHLTGDSSTLNSGGYNFTNVGGIDLQACNTQTIGPSTCTPGAPGCGWSDGDMITYGQGVWGDVPSPGNAAALLVANYDAVYASNNGLLEVGIPVLRAIR